MEPKHSTEFHMPSPSYWPITLAFALLLIAVGIIFNLIISGVGVLLTLVALTGWMLENRQTDEDVKADSHE